MNELARHNRERWNALAAAGVKFSQPWLDLDAATARQRVDRLGILGDLTGKRVLPDLVRQARQGGNLPA